jgi:hypothetical protein
MILETTYKSKSNARKTLLKREINAMQLGSGEPISMYSREPRVYTRNPTSAGSDIKPKDLSFAILADLLDEYGTLVTILEATSEKMTAKDMLHLLLQIGGEAKTLGELREG